MTNLDFLCIKYGQQLPREKNIKNLIRRSLGVLKEDGIYAMFLILEDKNKELREILIPLLNENHIKNYLVGESAMFPNDFKGFTEKLRDITQSLDKVFFLKMILERTLSYALYHP